MHAATFETHVCRSKPAHGLMAEWLGVCREYSDREEHISIFGLTLMSQTKRAAARKFLSTRTNTTLLLAEEASPPDGNVLHEPVGTP